MAVVSEPFEYLAQAHVAALIESRQQLVHEQHISPGGGPRLGAPRQEAIRCQVVEHTLHTHLRACRVTTVVTGCGDEVDFEHIAQVPDFEACS